MRRGGKNKIVFIILFLCLTNVVFGQMQTKIDTILCRSKNLIIEYPSINKVNVVNYVHIPVIPVHVFR